MKKLTYLILPLALYACTTVPETNTRPLSQQNSSGSIIDANTGNQQILNSYFWQLIDAKDAKDKTIDALILKDKPIELRFDNGNISIANACNRMGGAFTFVYNVLTVKPLIATKMMCQDELNQAEQAISSRIVGKQSVIFSQQDESPIITLSNAVQDKLVFKGVITPEAKYGSQAEVVFLEVAPQTKACVGVAPMQCLQTREIRYNEQGIKTYSSPEWENFYGGIEGYKHDPQQRQILRLKRYSIKNPPADGSSYAYVLDMIVESETAKQAAK